MGLRVVHEGELVRETVGLETVEVVVKVRVGATVPVPEQVCVLSVCSEQARE